MKKKILKWLRQNKKQKGFTLIEMVVVIAIIVLLLLIVAPNLVEQKKNAEKHTSDAFTTTLQTQVELYENEKPKKVPSFKEMREAGYLTDKQFAQSKDYTINNDGVVKKKGK